MEVPLYFQENNQCSKATLPIRDNLIGKWKVNSFLKRNPDFQLIFLALLRVYSNFRIIKGFEKSKTVKEL